MRSLLLFVFSWIIIINLFVLFTNNRLNLLPDTAYPWINPEYTFQVQDWNIFNLHSRWDSYWYLDIINNGYKYKGINELSNIVFFPVFPLSVKAIGVLLDLNFIYVGTIINLIALIISSVILYKISEEFHKNSNPLLSAVLFLFFPTAIFLTAFYSESLFIMFSLLFFYFVLKKNYWISALFGMLAALTRFSGILLVIPFLIEVFSERSNRKIQNIIPAIFIPAGTLIFFVYHYLTFHDFTLFFKVQNLWGRGFTLNREHFNLLMGTSVVNFIFDGAFTVFALISSFIVLKKLRLSYAVYMLLTIMIPLSSGTTMSIGRYLLPLFPLFILGASLKNEVLRYLWLTISVMLFTLYSILFTAHYWAG